MQEILEQLTNQLESGDASSNEFDEAAKKLAIVVIDAFQGELLEKGLLLVKAIADFSAALERAG